MVTGFLEEHDAPVRTWTDRAAEDRGLYAAMQWEGVDDGSGILLNVSYAEADNRPSVKDVRDVWAKRHNKGAAPVLMIVSYPLGSPRHAMLIGPDGDQPPIREMDFGQAQSVAASALDEHGPEAARDFILTTLAAPSDDLPGLTNQGLLATHELLNGVPRRDDWGAACARAEQIRAKRDQELVEALGYGIEAAGAVNVLTDLDTGGRSAVAVFLQPQEEADKVSDRFGMDSPVEYAMMQAGRDDIDWVITVRRGAIRLYSTATSGAAGQRGRTETFVELNLPMLPASQAGYLPLVFSAEALRAGGSLHELRELSEEFVTALADRLRERVYERIVPDLAVAIANRHPDGDLALHYRTALTVLFRLLFLAYADDNRLLPYRSNPDYTAVSLKQWAKTEAARANAGESLGYDNPLTPEIEPSDKVGSTALWERCLALFQAVREGHDDWGIPVYNGGLFSADGAVNPAGPIIQSLRLTDVEFAPALFRLVIDYTPDDDDLTGPIDFRGLSVREFGTIYEGLLESELARADQRLTLVHRDGVDYYVPAGDGDRVEVWPGEAYLHNKSGARKSSGSYFTKPFAVQHLLDHALVPTVREHLEKVKALYTAGRETSAAELLFDFRTADLAMGSGHFLTAVVDTIEREFSDFLALHPIPAVLDLLDELRQLAYAATPDNLEEIPQGALLRRLIARRCVYGVDINPISVELARVSMWIHTFVRGLPLSFLDHNLVCGNSLTGIGTLGEIYEAYGITSDDSQINLMGDPLKELLDRAREPLKRLARIADKNKADVDAARAAAEEAREALAPFVSICDRIAAARVGAAELHQFANVDDLIKQIGTGDGSKYAQTLDDLAPLHFPVAFPEVFIDVAGTGTDRNGFDVLIGNPPWQEATVEKDAFWALRFPGLGGLAEAQKQARISELEVQHPQIASQYEDELAEMEAIRGSLIGGPYPGMGTGDPDLYKAFAWRYWHLLRGGGRTGVVLPRTAMAAKGSTPWRQALAASGGIERVTQLTNTNGWVFDGVTGNYTVTLNVLHRSDGERPMRIFGPYRGFEQYLAGQAGAGVVVSPEQFQRWTPTSSVPLLPSEDAGAVFAQMRAQTPISALPFKYVRELDATNDKKHMVLDATDHEGLWPVYKGESFNLWEPDTGTYYAYAEPDHMAEHLHAKRKRQTRKGGAMEGMPAAWLNDPATLPCLYPRIAFRDICRATDSRSCIACLVPPQTTLANTAPYLRPQAKATSEDEAFLLGVMCSRIFDWQVRCTLELHLNLYVLEALAVPWPEASHPGRQLVTEIAGRLAAVDDRYSTWAEEVGVPVGSVGGGDEKDRLIIELDAVVAAMYGLSERQVRLVYSTFHPTWGHEPFTEAVLARMREIDVPAVTPGLSDG